MPNQSHSGVLISPWTRCGVCGRDFRHSDLRVQRGVFKCVDCHDNPIMFYREEIIQEVLSQNEREMQPVTFEREFNDPEEEMGGASPVQSTPSYSGVTKARISQWLTPQSTNPVDSVTVGIVIPAVQVAGDGKTWGEISGVTVSTTYKNFFPLGFQQVVPASAIVTGIECTGLFSGIGAFSIRLDINGVGTTFALGALPSHPFASFSVGGLGQLWAQTVIDPKQLELLEMTTRSFNSPFSATLNSDYVALRVFYNVTTP